MSDGPTSQVESNHAAYLEMHRLEAERLHEGEVALMVDGEIKQILRDGE